ncbi:MAG TPA: hypothetical protein VGU20_16830 [Stellaceae bacterium]|nr:hypothetical protein [Stellaceae bacterium]
MQQCVYCLGEFPRAQMSDDHVIAGSWYPDTTDERVQRLTAPACRDCNSGKFAAIERYVLTRLAMCVDPTHPAAAGIYEKAKRSIDPGLAKNEKDRRHRRKQREALFRDLEALDAVAGHVLPFSAVNFAMGSRTGLRIDAGRLNQVIEKWTRGFYYCIYGVPLSVSAKIEVFHVADRHALEAFEEIWHHARAIDGGVGVQVRVLSAEESGRREELYAFSIWGQFRAYAAVSENI